MATLVEIVPYDEAWPEIFAEIANTLSQLLGPVAAAVDRIGGTSVPGLPSKPFIDVDVTVRGIADISLSSAILTAEGYEPRDNRCDDNVWASVKRKSAPRQRIYLCPPGNEMHKRRIIFRDYLRIHDQTAAAYACLKQSLAKEFAHDGDSYTKAKTQFINEVLEHAFALCEWKTVCSTAEVQRRT